MTFHHIGDVLTSMRLRDELPPALKAAINAPSVEVASERLGKALEEQFWNKPYLLNGAVTGKAIWPCHLSLAELLHACRAKLAPFGKSACYRSIELRAAERVIGRMIDTAARLHAEGTLVGADRYRCATCGATALHDLPECPRDTIRDCDVLCERITETEERNAA